MTKVLAVLCVCFSFSHHALAWNSEGHMIVAQMAYNHLTPAVRAKCDALIAVPLAYGGDSTSNFVTAAVWADDYKGALDSASWHYIDLPFSLDGTSTNSFVPATFDVVGAINLSITILSNGSASLTGQATMLRYLLHFVGDIQQPLHTSDAFYASQPDGDAGGNGFALSGGNWGNLHSLWDSGGGYLYDYIPRPLDSTGQSTLAYRVAAIENDYPYNPNAGSIPNPMDWALEGLAIAETNAYVGITLNSTPSYDYLNEVETTTEQRMAAGGHRLADLLNTVIATNIASSPPMIVSQPTGRTDIAGNTATFVVTAVGATPLCYQWFQDGVAVVDGGNVSGSATDHLTLYNLVRTNSGGYTVVITNRLGSVTSQVATLIVFDPFLTSQPVSRNANVGDTITFSVTAGGTVPLAFQWRKDSAAVPGASAASLILTNVQGTNAGGYDVVVSNAFGTVTSLVARLTVNLATADAFNPGPNSAVWAAAVQADGKVVVGGSFTMLGGASRSYIGRLNSDGTLDATFNPGANSTVYSLAVQADGKILVGGYFSTLGGSNRSYIGRLNSDGKVDATFNPGANGGVNALAVQADGKILVGGYFTGLAATNRSYIGRLHADGKVDANFDPKANYYVNTLAMQTDGKILVGGNFTMLGGTNRSCIGRLNSDGTVDATFDPKAGYYVNALAVQADGKILVGGAFTTLGGTNRSYLGRLNSDGKVDTTFDPKAGYYVYSLAVQTDGQILVAGGFTTLGGASRNYIGRLNSDGAIDTTFNPGANSWVYSVMVQADGKILVGGYFSAVAGAARNCFARLNNPASASQSLVYNSSSVTWLRGGASPEVWRATFDISANRGATWTSLGSGTRIAGGWQLTGLSVPANADIRARGFQTGGRYDASAWFVETYAGPPLFVTSPSSRTNNAGTTATFQVACGGTPPLSYQWRKGGAPLTDGGNISGTQTPTLTLSNVFGGDAGGYSVDLGNPLGSVTSQVATLTVIDPAITVQPASQNANQGDNVTFNVTAVGTAMTYQWWKDATPLTQATDSALTLTGLQGADAGGYWVVVSGRYGSMTSVVAQLTVNLAFADGGFDPGADSTVLALGVQPDGKVVVGGYFSVLGGNNYNYLGRLNADGTPDINFNPWPNNYVNCLAAQADGKVVAGGYFTMLGGTTRNYIGRLNSDGTPDRTFDPGADGEVECLAVQADGKILAGGSFYTLGGTSCSFLGRLNSDGTPDTTFKPGANSYVYCFAVQPDGRILVGGCFTSLAGQTRNSLGRLNADGTPDTTFNPGANSCVYCLAVQPDGNILVGGNFTILAGQACNCFGRLKSNGTLDTSFNSGADSIVNSLAVQADGKFLAGGSFTRLAGQVRNHIARLNSDGTLDLTFNPGADSPVYALAIQPDGNILVGGDFYTLGGTNRNRMGRLNNTGPAAQSLSCDAASITWLRSGTSPEVWRATFDLSANGGTDWVGLGEGGRIPGGWQTAGLSLAANPSIRARGYATGGMHNGSDWIVEAYVGPPCFVNSPSSRTNNAGTTATFYTLGGGTPPLSCQWRKGDSALTDGGNISGAQTPTLTLSNVFGGDAGEYSVVLSSPLGSVTSRVAVLTVIDPVITSQPLSQSLNQGDGAAFNVAAVGTELTYQWCKDSAPLAQATASALTLSNLQGTDAGDYSVVVSGRFGSLTSAVAQLTVNLAFADLGFNPGTDGSICALAVQPDSKILVGGYFTQLGGTYSSCLGRLNSDGTPDTAFNPAADNNVYCLAIQPDGRILAGGYFTMLGATSCTYLGRLNSDGTLDTAFDPGADYIVLASALQPDGKFLLGGGFGNLGAASCSYLGRLNSDGTPDPLFDPGANNYVYCLAMQADGKILVGGCFTWLGGTSRNYIGRLNSDGTPDPLFDPGADNYVYCLAMQADGRILVGGSFTRLGGTNCSYLGRLNTDGTLDTSFCPEPNNPVYSLAIQADGKILVGGYFTALAGQSRYRIARLNADGTLDLNFNPGADSDVYALAVQPDGMILVGGYFASLAGMPRNRIARLNSTQPATQNLFFESSTLTWLRGGTGPEVWRTVLDASTNGVDWYSLGPGARIPGGWQWTNVAVPAGASVRARGFATGGMFNGSGWFVETNLTATSPVILSQPLSLTNNVGTGAAFSVAAGGTPTLYYQWRKDGANLVGATGATLALTGILERDQGLYSVIVSNSFGWVLSSSAVLSVNQPPVADASATKPVVISANGTDAKVVLDGTRSSDPDGDLLQYLWYAAPNSQPANLLAQGAVAVVVLPVGAHPLQLVVTDGMLSATNAVTVEVITAAQAVERLIARVGSSWPRSQPLIATLSAALASIQRGNSVSAVNQLLAFQNKVRAQVLPLNAALAASFIQSAQDVIDALSGGNFNAAGRPHGRFTSVARQANGRVKLQFSAIAGPVYILEASTNLVDWEMVGVAQDHGDGTLTCEDPGAANFHHRYYRIVMP